MVDIRKTPSLQHMAALAADNVPGTVRNLELFDAAQISISLNPGRRLFKPLMLGHPLDWAIRQLAGEKAHNVKPNIGLVEAFAAYAADKQPVAWFNECEKAFFRISTSAAIPVQPAGYWNDGGVMKVLWVQAWKGRTLDPLQRKLFNTILHQHFFVGDFKDSPLEWLDLRETTKGAGRDIEVLDSAALEFLSPAELNEVLGIFLEAFDVYAARKAARKAADKAAGKTPRKPKDDRTRPLFPDGPED